MKTRDLIRRLQELDPEGTAECVVGGEDIYTLERAPMYYDGRPTLLVHDPAIVGKAWSVVGVRFPASGTKIKFHTLDAEDVILNEPEIPVTYDTEDIRARYEEKVAEWRATGRRIEAEHQAWVAEERAAGKLP